MADLEPEYLTERQCAARFAVSPRTWRRWADIGHAPKAVKLSPGVARWKRAEVDAFAAKAEAAA